MWFERSLLATAAALTIVAVVSNPLASTSLARASSLRGGQSDPCTMVSPPLGNCQTCVNDTNCTNGGSYYSCVDSGSGSCEFCNLGSSSPCYGDMQLFDAGQCPNGVPFLITGSCITGVVYYPNAVDTYIPKGACPNNCPP